MKNEDWLWRRVKAKPFQPRWPLKLILLSSRPFATAPRTAKMSGFELSKLAVPGVSVLISFLAYTSQALFLYIEPSPLSTSELVQFNGLVICLWICYYRACTTDPGLVPQDWSPPASVTDGRDTSNGAEVHIRQRWCRKCEAYKPPRAHHCKTCRRSVT